MAKSADDLTMINHCLRHTCAYHCFDGYTARVQNNNGYIIALAQSAQHSLQESSIKCVCQEISERLPKTSRQEQSNLIKEYNSLQGQCYEMFKEIVYSKFKPQYDNAGTKSAIGPRQL